MRLKDHCASILKAISACGILLACSKSPSMSKKNVHQNDSPVTVPTSTIPIQNLPVNPISSPRNSLIPKVVIHLAMQADHQRLCLSDISVKFERGVRIETLKGTVRVEDQHHLLRTLVPVNFSNDISLVKFAIAPPQICGQSGEHGSITINPGIVYENGLRLGDYTTYSFEFIVGSQSDTVPVMSSNRIVVAQQSTSAANLTISGPRLNASSYHMNNWITIESAMPFYAGSDLKLLPIEGTNLISESTENRRRQYGNGDLIFSIRAAAEFVNKLYQDSVKISVGDLSLSNGETPFMLSGNERIYLHPVGSHANGQDADIAYIKDANGSIDWERNFWLLYSILDRTGVDLLMTAYTDRFRAMAVSAYQAGLINSIAVGRFDSPKFQNNADMNHDKHFHVSVRNSDNHYKFSRFTLADDVYNCYIKLRPGNRGVAGNFCRSLL